MPSVKLRATRSGTSICENADQRFYPYIKMAAKRKIEDTNDSDGNSSNIQHKRHETTTTHEITTNYSTQTDYGPQWYEQRGPWIALYDWSSGLNYYQNVSDYQTQWEKPAEWDSIHPLFIPANRFNHGYYYESVNASNVNQEENFKQSAADVEAKVKRLVTRPARRQVDPEEKEKLHWIPEGVTEYNIWYDRWVGEHWWENKDHGQSCDKSLEVYALIQICDLLWENGH